MSFIYMKLSITGDEDVEQLKNHVVANVAGLNVPFVGVDGASVCDKIESEDGQKASCPLKAGNKYLYKDSFPILSFYPNIEVNVHWSLNDGKDDIICFEVPAKIAN